MLTKCPARCKRSINVMTVDNEIAAERRPGRVHVLLHLTSASRWSLLVSIPQRSSTSRKCRKCGRGQEEEASWSSRTLAIQPAEMSRRLVILSSSYPTPSSMLLYPQAGQHLLYNSYECEDLSVVPCTVSLSSVATKSRKLAVDFITINLPN